MAKFLNTDLLNEWIPRLIKETERELVIIVPYIKTSDRIYAQLLDANKRGVETTLVFRENKLNPNEYDKLAALDNLNLMHHPNVHAKCYYNEKYLIIGSMNLYEYSERNNREMGMLLHRANLDNSDQSFGGDRESIFEDAIQEINTIIKSSELLKVSRETSIEGFEMDIIKTAKEKAEEECKNLNKVFMHKKFAPVGDGHDWIPTCKNYFDRIDVSLNHRAELRFQFDENRIEQIFKKFTPYYHEFRFDGYKLYWNHHKGAIMLYPNSRHEIWKNVTEVEEIQLMKNGIDQLISFLRPFI